MKRTPNIHCIEFTTPLSQKVHFSKNLGALHRSFLCKMKTSCIHLHNKHNHSESYPPEHFFLETTFKICKDPSKTHGSAEGSKTLSYLISTICSKFGGFEFCRVITFFEFLLVSSLVVVVKVPRKCLVNIRFFVLKTSFFHLHSSLKTACQNPRFEVKNTSNLRAW